jgi:hypothetical protein
MSWNVAGVGELWLFVSVIGTYARIPVGTVGGAPKGGVTIGPNEAAGITPLGGTALVLIHCVNELYSAFGAALPKTNSAMDAVEVVND